MGGGIRGLFQFKDQPRLPWWITTKLGPESGLIGIFENSFENFIRIIRDTPLPENVLMTLTVEPENRVRHGWAPSELGAKDYLFKIYEYDKQKKNYLLFCRNANSMFGWPKYNFAVVKIKKQELNEHTADTKEWDEGWEQGKWFLEVNLEETNKIIGKYQGEGAGVSGSSAGEGAAGGSDGDGGGGGGAEGDGAGPAGDGTGGAGKEMTKSKLSDYLKDQKKIGDSAFNTLFNDPLIKNGKEKITIPLRYKNKDTGKFEKPKNIDREFIKHLKYTILKKNKEELEKKIKNNDRTFFKEIDEHNSMVDSYEFDDQLKISEYSGL